MQRKQIIRRRQIEEPRAPLQLHARRATDRRQMQNSWGDKLEKVMLREDEVSITVAGRHHGDFIQDWFGRRGDRRTGREIHDDLKKNHGLYFWHVPFTAVLLDVCAKEPKEQLVRHEKGSLVGRLDFRIGKDQSFDQRWMPFYGASRMQIERIGLLRGGR